MLPTREHRDMTTRAPHKGNVPIIEYARRSGRPRPQVGNHRTIIDNHVIKPGGDSVLLL